MGTPDGLCPPRPALSQSTHLTLYSRHTVLLFFYKIAPFAPGSLQTFFSFSVTSPPTFLALWGPLPLLLPAFGDLSAGLCREHELQQHQRQPGFRKEGGGETMVSPGISGAGCLRSLLSVCTHGGASPGSRACCLLPRPLHYSYLLIVANGDFMPPALIVAAALL